MPTDPASIIFQFGLQALRVQQFRAGEGEERTAREISFPDQDAETFNRLGPGEDLPASWLGTPVFSNLTFLREGQEDFVIDTVLMSVSQSRTIIKSEVPGQSGTRKEYFGQGDYIVSIKGVLHTPRTNQHPSAQTRELVELLNEPRALQVVSDFLLLFDIYSIAIDEYNFFQREGFQNLQPFEITASSDEDIELVDDAENDL